MLCFLVILQIYSIVTTSIIFLIMLSRAISLQDCRLVQKSFPILRNTIILALRKCLRQQTNYQYVYVRVIVTSINDSLIVLRKALGVPSILRALNFCYLFMIFKISFLIICGNGFITYSYLKSSMSLRSAYGSFGKKLCRNISTFS